jgi:transcriptional regulator with XRE-family HTH domain
MGTKTEKAIPNIINSFDGNEIKKRRQNLRLKQRELAEKIEKNEGKTIFNQTDISRIEGGLKRNLSEKEIEILCRALDCSFGDLFQDGKDPRISYIKHCDFSEADEPDKETGRTFNEKYANYAYNLEKEGRIILFSHFPTHIFRDVLEKTKEEYYLLYSENNEDEYYTAGSFLDFGFSITHMIEDTEKIEILENMFDFFNNDKKGNRQLTFLEHSNGYINSSGYFGSLGIFRKNSLALLTTGYRVILHKGTKRDIGFF